MRRRSRWLVLPAAVLLLGGNAVAAAEEADPAVALDPARTTTLITGDRVTLFPDGRVSIKAGAGRAHIPMSTSTAGGRTTVIPADALPLLRADRLDRRLFDVTGLLAGGYDDRRADLPLILTGGGTVGSVTRRLPSIKATAVRAPKRDLRARWKALAGGGKVWLDGIGRYASAEGIQQIGAPAAWSAGLTGAGVTVGVIDSGVDAGHPDLAGRVAAQRDFSPPAEGGDPGDGTVRDTAGHGTHVASILAGSGAGSGGRTRGVAPGARLVSAKVGDWEVTESSVIAAMEWMAGTERAKVVNLSLGFESTPGVDPMEAAVADLTARHGTLFVVASGNSGNNGNDPTLGNDYDVGSPATAPAALTVGAVDHQDVLAGFSSRGPAPGDLVKPDVTAPGVDVTGALSSDAPGGGEELYTTSYGTSFAAPHAAGAAAVLAQAHPGWTPSMIKSALMGSARPATGTSVFAQGAGRVDVPRALAGTLLSDPPSVSFGTQAWPHTGEAKTVPVTYRNVGTAPVTVRLALEMQAPRGMVTVTPATLTVPAGGTAQARVTATSPASARTGAYSGRLVATAGRVSVGTPVGLVREAETHDLTIHQVGRDGAPSEDYLTKVIGLDVPFSFDSTGAYPWPTTYTLRVPRGRYAVVSRMGRPAGDVYEGTVLVHPGLAVGAATELTLDARVAKPVGVTVPEAGAAPASGAVDIGLRTTRGWTSESFYVPGANPLFTAELADGPRDGYVSRIRTAFQGGTGAGAYAYQLGWVLPGDFPTGFARTVTDAELAVERVAARQQAPGSFPEFRSTLVTPAYPLVTVDTATDLPAEVRYSPGTWRSNVFEWSDNPEDTYWTVRTDGQPVTYRAGKPYASRWNAPVIAPCLAPGHGVSWHDGLLRVNVPMACDGAGHAGEVDPATGSTTLFRDGTAVASSERAGRALLNVKPSRGTYRLNAEATRGAPFRTSIRSTVDWTFTDPAVLPRLHTVRMSPALDGLAPAGGFTIPLAVDRAATRVTLDVSYDDGATWQPATVRRTGPGGYEAAVTHPATGFASLRATATGGGSTVSQTVVRAYEIG